MTTEKEFERTKRKFIMLLGLSFIILKKIKQIMDNDENEHPQD